MMPISTNPREQKTIIPSALRIKQRQTVRDCLEGEDTIKGKETTYLPKPSGMDVKYNPNGNAVWENYLGRTSYFPVCERTLMMMVGMCMRVAPTVKAPANMEGMIHGFDGLTVEEIATWMFKEKMSVNQYGVLVEMDANPSSDNIPYVVLYEAESIVEWKWQRRMGIHELVYVKLADDIVGEVDGYISTEWEEVERYRELYLDDDGLYEQKVTHHMRPIAKNGVQTQKDTLVDEVFRPIIRGERIDYLPFIISPDVEDAKPMMLDLAKMSLTHYRYSADYAWALFMTAQPTPWATGVSEDDKLEMVGSGALWKIGNESARVGMLEFTGAGIKSQKDAIDDVEQRMAMLGSYMITGTVNRNESAETARLRNAGETSALREAVECVEKTLMWMYRTAARMMGNDPDQIDVTCNRHFVEATMRGSELIRYVEAWQKGGIDDDSYVNVLKDGEVFDAAIPNEELIGRLKKKSEEIQAMALIEQNRTTQFPRTRAQPDEARDVERTADEE